MLCEQVPASVTLNCGRAAERRTHSLSTLFPETLSTTEDLVNSGRACAARKRVAWACACARRGGGLACLLDEMLALLLRKEAMIHPRACEKQNG